MKPRDYQNVAIQSIFDYFEKHTGNPIAALPTGTGKSLVIAWFIKTVFDYYANQKILVVTHVKELIEQNYEKIKTIWPSGPIGINSSGLNRRDYNNNIIFCGIGSVARYYETFGHVDLVMIDECHLVSPKDETLYRKFINGLMIKNPNLKVIGLTATYYRMNNGLIHKMENSLFTDLCCDMTTAEWFNWFIQEGYLSPLIAKKTDTQLDLTGVGSRSGDFISSELQRAIDKDWITEKAMDEAIYYGQNRESWMVFATGIEHAMHCQEVLEQKGISAGVIHSKMKKSERDSTIKDFKEGRIKVICNNNVLTTGFDHPKLDLIIALRPTQSVALWVQMLGRGTRPVYADGYDLSSKDGRLEAILAGGKENCLVLDFGGNTRRLGPINDPFVPRTKKKKGGGDAPIKICDKCGAYVAAGKKFCETPDPLTGVLCDYEFKFESKFTVDASSKDVLKQEAPVVETFPVMLMTYNTYSSPVKGKALVITYHCGKRHFKEYLCFEYNNARAVGFAKKLWKDKTSLPVPETVKEAKELAQDIPKPTYIRVWTNKQNPEILKFCYDPNGFGDE